MLLLLLLLLLMLQRRRRVRKGEGNGVGVGGGGGGWVRPLWLAHWKGMLGWIDGWLSGWWEARSFIMGMLTHGVRHTWPVKSHCILMAKTIPSTSCF
jgi:hypothetical protein